jgi:hypothetical protein
MLNEQKETMDKVVTEAQKTIYEQNEGINKDKLSKGDIRKVWN